MSSFSSLFSSFFPLSPDYADTVGSSPPSHLLSHKTNPTNHKIPTVNQGIVCKYPTLSHCLSLSPFFPSFLSHPPYLPFLPPLLSPLPDRRCWSTQSTQRKLTRTSKWRWSRCWKWSRTSTTRCMWWDFEDFLWVKGQRNVRINSSSGSSEIEP